MMTSSNGEHFPCYWPFVREIHRSPVNFPHKVQWRGALMFSLICARMNGWVNNREAGDLRRYRVHYDVIVMFYRHGLDTSRHETESCRILLIRFSSGNLRSKRSKVNDYHNRKFFDRYKWLRNWGRLNIKMSCQYKDCHHKDKTVSQTCVEIWKYGIAVLEDCPGVLNTLILTHSSKIFAIL